MWFPIERYDYLADLAMRVTGLDNILSVIGMLIGLLPGFWLGLRRGIPFIPLI